jgi:D-sedoheptulose 7-phosphate isomerase
MTLSGYLADLARTVEATGAANLDAPVSAGIEALVVALGAQKPLLLCGNGGSAADAMHIAGELVGRYKRERPGFNATALGSDAAVTTAWGNDYDFDTLFERQVEALGVPGGVVWGLSTSGNSENVVRAMNKAKEIGMTALSMTGAGGGRLADVADILIAVPSTDTPRIQEIHTALYHYICETVERRLTE